MSIIAAVLLKNFFQTVSKIKTKMLEKVESVTSDALTSDTDSRRLSLSVR